TLLLALRHPLEHGEGVSRAQVILGLGRIALLKGDRPQASSLLGRALEEALDSAEEPRAFEQALCEMGEDDLVVRTLERRIERTPSVAARAIALGSLVDVWTERLGRSPELGGRIQHHTEAILRDLAEEQSASSEVWSSLWSVLARLEGTAMLGRLHQD